MEIHDLIKSETTWNICICFKNVCHGTILNKLVNAKDCLLYKIYNLLLFLFNVNTNTFFIIDGAIFKLCQILIRQ